MKEQKIAQPASRRVRDAAEGLLSSLMEQVDFYTVYCGAESLSSTIDEIAFVYLASGEMLTMLQAAQNFRYFVLDNNVLLGIYEDVSQMGYEQQAKVSGMEMKNDLFYHGTISGGYGRRRSPSPYYRGGGGGGRRDYRSRSRSYSPRK